MREDIRETATKDATNVARASENGAIGLECDIEAPPSSGCVKAVANASHLQRIVPNETVDSTSSYLKSYIPQALTAAILLSTVALMIKVLSEDVSIFQISFICSSLSTVILSILSHYTGVSSEERAPNGLLVLLGGIFAAIGLLTSAVATSLLPLSEYAFMSNSFPGPIPVTVSISLHVAVLCPVVVTAVLSWLFGMEQLGPVSWISAIGCLCGNALLASPPFLFGQSGDWGMSRIGGIACAASANVAFGLSFIILRYLGTSVNATALGAGIHAIVVLCSLPFVASGYPKELIFVTSWQSNALLIGITVSVVLIHCMLSRAFQGGSAIRSREAFLTNMLISCALGVMVLAEGMTWTTLTGDALIMVSVLFVVTRTSPEDTFQHVTRSGIKNQIIELTT